MPDTLIVLKGFSDELQREIEHEFEGRCLAAASSHRDDHSALIHGLGEFAPQRTRCSACRWFEIQIFRNGDSQWVVQTIGKSIVPGEEDRHRVHFCETARAVVTALALTRGENVFLPNVAKRALDIAADADERLAPLVDQVLDS